MTTSCVRIIAGIWRGRKISFDDAEGLRPSTDRIRETVFNWLMRDIVNADCLDAFAGSGALGFEALSRGAHSVTMLDNNPKTILNLKKAASILKPSKLHIIHQDTLRFLKQQTNRFDIIFLDPPFAKDYLDSALTLIQTNNCLKENGLVYIEYPKNSELDLSAWKIIKQKTAGQVNYSLLTTDS